MDSPDELRALPETYALALRLRAEGLDDAAIGRVLDIEAESVAPLLTLARSKLAGLAERRRDGKLRPPRPDEPDRPLGE